jgi:hypothetical protein
MELYLAGLINNQWIHYGKVLKYITELSLSRINIVYVYVYINIYIYMYIG